MTTFKSVPGVIILLVLGVCLFKVVQGWNHAITQALLQAVAR